MKRKKSKYKTNTLFSRWITLLEKIALPILIGALFMYFQYRPILRGEPTFGWENKDLVRLDDRGNGNATMWLKLRFTNRGNWPSTNSSLKLEPLWFRGPVPSTGGKMNEDVVSGLTGLAPGESGDLWVSLSFNTSSVVVLQKAFNENKEIYALKWTMSYKSYIPFITYKTVQSLAITREGASPFNSDQKNKSFTYFFLNGHS